MSFKSNKKILPKNTNNLTLEQFIFNKLLVDFDSRKIDGLDEDDFIKDELSKVEEDLNVIFEIHAEEKQAYINKSIDYLKSTMNYESSILSGKKILNQKKIVIAVLMLLRKKILFNVTEKLLESNSMQYLKDDLHKDCTIIFLQLSDYCQHNDPLVWDIRQKKIKQGINDILLKTYSKIDQFVSNNIDLCAKETSDLMILHTNLYFDLIKGIEFKKYGLIQTKEEFNYFYMSCLNFSDLDILIESNIETNFEYEFKKIFDHKELTKLAIQEGFKMIRYNGDHGIMKNEKTNQTVVIPQGRDIGKGLSLKIQKDIFNIK